MKWISEIEARAERQAQTDAEFSHHDIRRLLKALKIAMDALEHCNNFAAMIAKDKIKRGEF